MTEFVDSTLAVSDADRAALARIAPAARVDCLPMGIDTSYFAPSPGVMVDPTAIVMTGSFEWAPKRHNLHVLVTEIFPRIRALVPDAQLTIVGKGLSDAALARLRGQEGVDCVGAVADVRPYIARASVLINYVESGGGIAIKILEAMAMAKPVVANDIAAEGIAAMPGRDLMVASTQGEFAEFVARLLADPALRAHLGRNGRELVVANYSSTTLARKLVAYYEALAASPRLLRTHSR